MRNYLLLLGVNLKTMLRGAFSQGMRSDTGKIRFSYIVLYLMAALGMVTLAGMVIWLETAVYGAAASVSGLTGIDLPRLLIGLALLLSMVMTLLFGVFHTMGAMYFNRDTAATAHLPIGPRVQMAARWTEIYLSEVIFSLVILLPMLINHGIATGGGVLYYLTAALTLLTAPLYPLSMALLLASVLARFSALTRNKEVWMVLGTMLMLVVVLGGEWLLLPQIPEDADAMFFLQLLLDNEKLLNLLVGAFPPVMWAVHAVDGNAAMLALYLAAGVGAIAAVISATGGSFQQVCMRHTEHATVRKPLRRREKSSFDASTPFVAIFRRELNEVIRTPVYLLNGVLGVLMMPIMLVAMSVGASAGAEETGAMAITEVIAELTGSLPMTDMMLIMAAMLSLMLFMCPVASTAISREGKRLPIMRMIPVSPAVILWAKIAAGMLIIGIGSVVMAAAFTVILGTAYLPCAIGAALLVNILSCTVNIGDILVDVIKPVLTWKSENEAMKQNFNVVFGMLIGTVMAALVIVPVVLLHQQAAWVRLLTAVVLLSVECALAVLVLYKVGVPRLASLEP